MATISSAARRLKPKTTPRVVRTAEKTARRRVPEAIGTTGAGSALMPWSARLFLTISRFHSR